MTLYGYFRHKHELLGALIDAAVGDERPTLSGSWREQLRQLVRVAHQNLTAHPSLVEIRFRQPVLRPEALRFGEAGMGILRAAGFQSDEAARAFPSALHIHPGVRRIEPRSATRSSFVSTRQRRLPAWRRTSIRTWRETAAEFSAAIGGEDAFEYGLERILDGLEATLHRVASLP